MHGNPWTRCRGTYGGDEGRDCFKVRKIGHTGGTSSLGEGGHMRSVGRIEVEGQEVGIMFGEEGDDENRTGGVMCGQLLDTQCIREEGFISAFPVA